MIRVPPSLELFHLDDTLRLHEMLESTKGVVAGPHGAAARLGINRSTLLFRMKKLGIPRGAAGRRYKMGAPLLRAVNG